MSGECDKCSEHALECSCRSLRPRQQKDKQINEIQETEYRLAANLKRLFDDIEKNSIQIGEDEHAFECVLNSDKLGAGAFYGSNYIEYFPSRLFAFFCHNSCDANGRAIKSSQEGYNFNENVSMNEARKLGNIGKRRRNVMNVVNMFLNVRKLFSRHHQKSWINVEDRFPEEEKSVLAWNGYIGGGFYVATYRYFPNGKFFTSGSYVLYGISHWMPLPEPPIQ